MFDRFHKIDKSRSLNREGWGLGLYIVKTIICSHGEDISVTSRDGKTEFTFTLAGVNRSVIARQCLCSMMTKTRWSRNTPPFPRRRKSDSAVSMKPETSVPPKNHGGWVGPYS